MHLSNAGIIRVDTGKAVLKSVPIPKLQDDYILVKVVTVALNPTDWTTLDAPGDNGSLVGCDYAGIVEAVGPAVKRSFKKGDRIAGFGHGGGYRPDHIREAEADKRPTGNDANYETGAFAKYIAVKGDVQLHIPDDVSFEEACTFGVGLNTAAYGLYKVLGLPWPNTPSSGEQKTVLIYGGSTATGTLAVQLAKWSGLRVVTTASPKNFDLLKQRGADVVLDYVSLPPPIPPPQLTPQQKAPDVGRQLYAATHGTLAHVFDCASMQSSANICAEAFGPAGGKYAVLLDGITCPKDNVETIFYLAYSVTGEEYIFEGEHYPADPEFFAFGVKFMELVEGFWRQGGLKPHPQRYIEGGLRGAMEGMQLMKEGKYSGEKLVCRVEETAWP
jgi:NADPH:quinone reductase-like Zn-dependent oxidoreductase